MKKVGIAILGLGVVGGGTYKILTTHREFYQKTQDVDLVVESVLEPSKEKISVLGIERERVATNITEIVSNPEVNIVVECIGGTEVAREFVLKALYAGKTVVTSNKVLYSKYSHELEKAAKRHNAGLHFEASCMGGVPIIRSLLDGVQANVITSMMGIVNGTTNYILSKMSAENASYEEVLKEAQKLGYAEANPEADVEGWDAAYKLSILSSIAFHTKVPVPKVFREGITAVSNKDIEGGKALGYCLKLLAIGKQSEEGIEVRVHPTLIPENHPLASVNGSFNAMFLTGDSVGEVMLYGKGAGDLPTGSAIVSDIIFEATHNDHKYSTFKNSATAERGVKFVSNFKSAYYLRLSIENEKNVLSKVVSILDKYGVSIFNMHRKQESDRETLNLITNKTCESAIRGAVAKINATELTKVESVLRVVL